MRRLTTGLIALSLLCSILHAQEVKPVPAPVPGFLPPPPHARMAAVYRVHCQSCHGERGDGNGPASHFLTPRPRDFADGEFKLRSTGAGDIPTDGDLERTIRRGVPGTAMPAFQGRLSDGEVKAVIDIMKRFSPRFEVSRPGKPLELPPTPPQDPQSVERGRGLFTKLACVRCHGEDARGNGPAAVGLRDATCYLTRPRDLTARALYKGGASPAEIFRTLTTGMDGTPMTALRSRVSDGERWDLAYFLSALAR